MYFKWKTKYQPATVNEASPAVRMDFRRCANSYGAKIKYMGDGMNKQIRAHEFKISLLFPVTSKLYLIISIFAEMKWVRNCDLIAYELYPFKSS